MSCLSDTARNEIPIARLQYFASRIHKLGPRPFFELLRELASGADLPSVLERYGSDRTPCRFYHASQRRPLTLFTLPSPRSLLIRQPST
jgi:hypothetical protein